MRTLIRSLTILVLCGPPLAASLASGGHSGLPTPQTTLLADEVRVDFVVPEDFPVPVVEVSINGSGPWRLAVDTGMGGTVLLRQELVRELGLPVVGRAMVGDSSGENRKPAELVRIDSMRLGQLEVSGIIGLGFAAGRAHIEEVPDDIHGILGNRIYADLLMTLDYPARRIFFRTGELSVTDPAVVEFEEWESVMAVEMNLAGRSVPVIVDSGSRGTITLPESFAGELPLREELREIEPVSTVSNTYRRRVARLDGRALLAGTTLVDPQIAFADEHTPKLIGYGVLKHFAITVDQAHGRLRWVPAEKNPLEGIAVER